LLFNSIEFAFFLPIVFILYWFVLNRNRKLQNTFILFSSYIFYGWWDWRFLTLIFLSSIIDYIVGRKLSVESNEKKRKLLLFTSIFFNIGFLGVFKYFNFFVQNFVDAFSLFGQYLDFRTLNIVLPVGISFYTFQTISYSIDVYRRKLEPTKDIIAFFTFVSFFPQLVAGPIERATNLLPQFYKKRQFNYQKAADGMRQILWGLFKKMVVADNCAKYVNNIFDNYTDYTGSTLLLGSVLFAFQIYCDFSGYSDIAIGTARLFGFNLMRNFAFPYFSRDIAEFWRRWHISLSSWFRDYVYIPLGGSRSKIWGKIRNIFVIFLVSGFWHGANCTFIMWGFINAVYFLPLMMFNLNRKNISIVAKDKFFPSIKETAQILCTFCITLIAWVFFRSESIGNAFSYIRIIFSASLFSVPQVWSTETIVFICLLLVFEWTQRAKEHGLQLNTNGTSRLFRWILYYAVAFLILYFRGAQQEFIYFQF